MSPPIIACDVDEVCADLLTEWLRRYSVTTGDILLPEDLDGWHLDKQVKHSDVLWKVLADPGIYDDIVPVPGSRAVITELKTLGRVVFVSSCYPGSEEFKLRWLKFWGFLAGDYRVIKKHPDFVSAFDKSLVRADILFDDNTDNVDHFKGAAFLVNHFHNRNTKSIRERINFYEAPWYVRRYIREHEEFQEVGNTPSLRTEESPH